MSSAASEPSSGRSFPFAQFLLGLPWVMIVIAAWRPLRDNSFLWHVRAGELQLDSSEVITTDPFSFTRSGETWLTQSWLAELVYGKAESVVGLGFVPVLILLSGVVIFTSIGLVAYRYSQTLTTTAIVMVLSMAMFLTFMVPRPVLLSFALMLLVVLAWSSPRWRWTIPLLFWVWASTHGSFIIGLVYLAIWIAIERDWGGLPTLLVSAAAVLATAHGIGVVGILLSFLEAQDALQYLTEWRAPGLGDPGTWAVIAGFGALLFGAYRRLIEPRHLLLIVPMLLLGLRAVRAMPPEWIALIPLVALALKGVRFLDKRRLGVVAATVFLVILTVFPFLLRQDGGLDEERFPVAALASLDSSRTFHDDVAGGYLIWAEGPERAVFIDDRAELYGERIGEFVGVRTGEVDWKPVFTRDGIEQALLLVSEPLVEDLGAAGWRTTYVDPQFVVLRS